MVPAFSLEWVRYRVLKPSNCSVMSEAFGSTTIERYHNPTSGIAYRGPSQQRGRMSDRLRQKRNPRPAVECSQLTLPQRKQEFPRQKKRAPPAVPGWPWSAGRKSRPAPAPPARRPAPCASGNAACVQGMPGRQRRLAGFARPESCGRPPPGCLTLQWRGASFSGPAASR